MKRALIIGCEGQDGVYLSKNLEKKNYETIGIGRNIIHSTEPISVNCVDILQREQINNLLCECQPDEIYHLAAFHQSSENSKIDDILLSKKSIDIHINSLLYLLDGIKEKSKHTKLFYAASSHIFGNPDEEEQDEKTPFKPNCIYGITKTAGVNLCQYYRKQFNVFSSVGILYNHESPLRKSTFISKKIVDAAIAIKNNYQDKLIIGDLNAKIDWGYAPDYVEAMHRILQLSTAENFIISSGSVHTVQEFVIGVFKYLNLDWKKYVYENPSIITKKSKNTLKGNNMKLRLKTGWRPSINFDELIKILVDECIINFNGDCFSKLKG